LTGSDPSIITISLQCFDRQATPPTSVGEDKSFASSIGSSEPDPVNVCRGSIFRQTEIEHLGVAAFRDEDVPRLNIPMNNTGSVAFIDLQISPT
jgi:hypothetical protein